LPITLYEAVLGAKVRVPTLDGAVELSIPKNTTSGRTFRLKGKGLPKAKGATGELFVTVRIALPDGSDAELEALCRNGAASTRTIRAGLSESAQSALANGVLKPICSA